MSKFRIRPETVCRPLFIGIILAALLTICVISLSDNSDAASSYEVKLFIGDGTQDGTIEFFGTGTTIKEIITNALVPNGHSISFDYRGSVTKLDDIESTTDHPLYIYKWTPIKGWVRTQANALGNTGLENGTSYYIYQSAKKNNFETGQIDYPGPEKFKPTSTGYFYIKMVEDLCTNDYVKSILTEEQRSIGFWISGNGSDMAEAFDDACRKMRVSGYDGFELVINLTDGSDYKGWLGSFMGLGDDKLNADEYRYWSQFNWDPTKSQWVYSECLGHYDPGVMPYSCIVRQITLEGSAEAIECPPPSEIPKALINGSPPKVSYIGFDGDVAYETEVDYFGPIPEKGLADVTLSNGDVIKFSGWNFTSDSGYGVLTDLRIEPLFEYELYSGTSDRATISMDLSGSDYISIGEKTISALKSSGNALEVKIKGGLITLDTTAVSSLEGREYKVNVNSIPVDVLPEKLYEELSDSELFEIDFGGQHNFGGGTLSISLYYNVPDGKNSSDLVVYHIENGEKNIVQSKYSDGRITFDVSGLSYFAVTYNPSNDENSSIMQYATIVIVVILVFGTAIIAMRHIKQTNRSY